MIQPAARLCGRVSRGLTPWHRRSHHSLALPRSQNRQIWSETWQPPEERLRSIEALLIEQGIPTGRGGEYDNWDLEVRGGLFASVRTRLGVEEYPRGRQYLRFRAWPRFSMPACLLAVFPVGLAIWAAFQHSSAAALILGTLAVLLIMRAVGDCGAAMSNLMAAFERYGDAVRGVPAVRTPPMDRRHRMSRSAHDAVEQGLPRPDVKTVPESPSRDTSARPAGWDPEIAIASALGPANNVGCREEPVDRPVRARDGDAAESVVR
jgi:hypothetical protein